jgi:hypothetical protein
MLFSFLPWWCTLKMEALVGFCKKTFPGFPTWEIQLLLKETVKQKTKNTYLLQLAYTSFKKYSLWDESYFAPLLLVKVVLMLLAMKICLKFAGAWCRCYLWKQAYIYLYLSEVWRWMIYLEATNCEVVESRSESWERKSK